MSDAGSLDGVTRWRTSLRVPPGQGVSIHAQRRKRRCSGVAATRATAAAAAVVLGLTVSACSSSGDASSTAPTSPTSSPPSWSAAPTTANPSQDAQSQAVAFVPTYLGTIDDLYLDPSRALDDIYQIAVAPDAVAEATAIGKFRAQGYRQTGRLQLVSASAGSVDLTNVPAASPSPVLPSVVVTACVDVNQVSAVDATGQSIVPSDRPRYLVEQLTVVNPHYPDPSSWRGRTTSKKEGGAGGGGGLFLGLGRCGGGAPPGVVLS